MGAPLDLNRGPAQLSAPRWTSTGGTAGPQQPDRMPEYMPDRMSDKISKNMSNKIP